DHVGILQPRAQFQPERSGERAHQVCFGFRVPRPQPREVTLIESTIQAPLLKQKAYQKRVAGGAKAPAFGARRGQCANHWTRCKTRSISAIYRRAFPASSVSEFCAITARKCARAAASAPA